MNGSTTRRPGLAAVRAWPKRDVTIERFEKRRCSTIRKIPAFQSDDDARLHIAGPAASDHGLPHRTSSTVSSTVRCQGHTAAALCLLRRSNSSNRHGKFCREAFHFVLLIKRVNGYAIKSYLSHRRADVRKPAPPARHHMLLRPSRAARSSLSHASKPTSSSMKKWPAHRHPPGRRAVAMVLADLGKSRRTYPGFCRWNGCTSRWSDTWPRRLP